MLCNKCLPQLTLWVRIPSRRGVLDTTLCDKVCQWLATGRWFSLGPPVFSNKDDCHDITEILLKVALSTIKQTSKKKKNFPDIFWNNASICDINICVNYSAIVYRRYLLNLSHIQNHLKYKTKFTCIGLNIHNYLCNQCLSPLMLWTCEFESRSGCTWGVQHYVIKFVSDLRQVGGFPWVLRFYNNFPDIFWNNASICDINICVNYSAIVYRRYLLNLSHIQNHLKYKTKFTCIDLVFLSISSVGVSLHFICRCCSPSSLLVFLCISSVGVAGNFILQYFSPGRLFDVIYFNWMSLFSIIKIYIYVEIKFFFI
jgi:hypothetical protein